VPSAAQFARDIMAKYSVVSDTGRGRQPLVLRRLPSIAGGSSSFSRGADLALAASPRALARSASPFVEARAKSASSRAAAESVSPQRRAIASHGARALAHSAFPSVVAPASRAGTAPRSSTKGRTLPGAEAAAASVPPRSAELARPAAPAAGPLQPRILRRPLVQGRAPAGSSAHAPTRSTSPSVVAPPSSVGTAPRSPTNGRPLPGDEAAAASVPSRSAELTRPAAPAAGPMQPRILQRPLVQRRTPAGSSADAPTRSASSSVLAPAASASPRAAAESVQPRAAEPARLAAAAEPLARRFLQHPRVHLRHPLVQRRALASPSAFTKSASPSSRGAELARMAALAAGPMPAHILRRPLAQRQAPVRSGTDALARNTPPSVAAPTSRVSAAPRSPTSDLALPRMETSAASASSRAAELALPAAAAKPRAHPVRSLR